MLLEPILSSLKDVEHVEKLVLEQILHSLRFVEHVEKTLKWTKYREKIVIIE